MINAFKNIPPQVPLSGIQSQIMRLDRHGEAYWGWASEPANEVTLIDDFVQSDYTGNLGWSRKITGTDAKVDTALNRNVEGNHPGVVILETGPTPVGSANINLGPSHLKWGDKLDFYYLEFCVKTPILSNDLDQFDVRLGLGDRKGSDVYKNGVFLRLDSSSPNWQLVSSNKGQETVANSGIAATEDSWFVVAFTVRKDSLNFFINREFIGNYSHQMTSKDFGLMMQTNKTTGLQNRELWVDYVLFRQVFKEARFG